MAKLTLTGLALAATASVEGAAVGAVDRRSRPLLASTTKGRPCEYSAVPRSISGVPSAALRRSQRTASALFHAGAVLRAAAAGGGGGWWCGRVGGGEPGGRPARESGRAGSGPAAGCERGAARQPQPQPPGARTCTRGLCRRRRG